MADLSLLLDVILKSNGATAKREFCECGVLHQLQVRTGPLVLACLCVKLLLGTEAGQLLVIWSSLRQSTPQFAALFLGRGLLVCVVFVNFLCIQVPLQFMSPRVSLSPA